jgi:hypothetical protein
MTQARFPALSVRQPYANAILYGAKDIENKNTRTHFRGTILLHASASLADKAVVAAHTAMLREAKALGPTEEYSPVRGALIGTVDIVDCLETSTSDWFSGPFGWVLSNPREFKRPIPYKGAVGIFYVGLNELAGTHAVRIKPGSSMNI